ncbi:MAG: cation diffusion facilitator family transporter [Burkholderia sp.]|nr:cation diffusion facilitator family transporter [Burkholderia sp.]
MITGESDAPEVRSAIRKHIAARQEVETIIHRIALQWGEHVMVAVQAKMQPQIPMTRWSMRSMRRKRA